MFSPKKIRLMMSVLTSAAVLVGCAESTGPNAGNDASVQGRVEETTPPASSPSATGPQRAAGGNAQTVAVVQIQADGSFMELATAEVEAGGSFTVEGVPAGRTELAVVAYADGEAVGSVLIHEESRAGFTIVSAPINAETTLEARTYSEVRAGASGEASTSSELALFMHADGSSVDAAAASQAEIQAAATAYATASATLTAAYEMSGSASLDAAARAAITANAAVDFAVRRHNGMSLRAAHDLFTEAALDAFVDAGAELEATVTATAAAASTFDAALEGSSSIRGDLDVQPVRINLLARERLAASFESTSESSVAVAVEDVIASARASLSFGLGLIDLRALIDSTLSAVVDAGADACVSRLAAGASSTVQAEVRARAEDAFEAARLEARLQSATTATAAVGAMASYRADVRAAVDAMIAASGSTTADAEVLTSIFIAASGGAYIR